MNHGLSQETVGELRRVLAREPEVEKAILYGHGPRGPIATAPTSISHWSETT